MPKGPRLKPYAVHRTSSSKQVSTKLPLHPIPQICPQPPHRNPHRLHAAQEVQVGTFIQRHEWPAMSSLQPQETTLVAGTCMLPQSRLHHKCLHVLLYSYIWMMMPRSRIAVLDYIWSDCLTCHVIYMSHSPQSPDMDQPVQKSIPSSTRRYRVKVPVSLSTKIWNLLLI